MNEREKTISKLYDLANDLRKNWTREKENTLWEIASDYNREHDNEIFVCEDWENNETKRLYIEDDYFIIQF